MLLMIFLVFIWISFQNQSASSGVNLLRALNYDCTTRSGLHIQKTVTHNTGDINHNSPEGDMSYKLSSAIVHLGDVYSGHFICYRRSPQTVQGTRDNERWLCCSDTSVTPCYLNDVLSSEAYMLLYERM
jgi:ubiquitin C-terminal hydrolase